MPRPRARSSGGSSMSDSDSAAPESAPIGEDEFRRLMAAVGPFERRPAFAVAVSGGADSMALALLADRWARACGGTLTALTVDHRLRPESREEAAEVGRWLAERGIAHRVLAWADARGGADLQARARAAPPGV